MLMLGLMLGLAGGIAFARLARAATEREHRRRREWQLRARIVEAQQERVMRLAGAIEVKGCARPGATRDQCTGAC